MIVLGINLPGLPQFKLPIQIVTLVILVLIMLVVWKPFGQRETQLL